MDPMKATKEVIAPLAAGLFGMVLLPPALVWAAIKALRIRDDPHEFCTSPVTCSMSSPTDIPWQTY